MSRGLQGLMMIIFCLLILQAVFYFSYLYAKLLQLCATLYDPMDCSLPGSSVQGDSPGKNTEVGCHALFQGIFPTEGLNSGIMPCRRILYHLSHQGSPQRPLELSRPYMHLTPGFLAVRFFRSSFLSGL